MTKAEGIHRIIYKNVNGFQPWLKRNPKLMKFCNIIDELQADIVGICEHRINFAHEQVVNGLRQLFQREASIATIAGFNRHENMARIQAMDKIIQFHRVSDTNHDPSGLGR